jgi:hypothetical protein
VRRALPIVALLALGLAAAGCCGVDPRESALVDDEIASLGSGAKIGLSPADVKAIADDIAPLETGTRAHVMSLLARGLRTPAEIARISSDVVKVQARWKSAR